MYISINETVKLGRTQGVLGLFLLGVLGGDGLSVLGHRSKMSLANFPLNFRAFILSLAY